MPGIDRVQDGGLMQRIRTLEQQVAALTKGTPLRSASITEGGLTVGGNGWISSDNWDGTSESNPGTAGWALGGALGTAIFNTLVLRKGIVGNDALSAPVSWAYATASQDNFDVPSTFADRAIATITTPVGFNSAILLVYGKVRVYNPGAGSWLTIEAGRAGETFGGMPDPLPGTAYSVHDMLGIQTLSGLTGGGSIATAVRVSATSALPVRSDHLAYTRSLALFFRT